MNKVRRQKLAALSARIEKLMVKVDELYAEEVAAAVDEVVAVLGDGREGR